MLSLAARGIARGAGAAKGVPAVLESFSFASTGYALFPMFHHQDSSVDDIPGAVHALCFSARPRAPSPMVSWVLSCWPPGGEKSSVSCRSMFGSFSLCRRALISPRRTPKLRSQEDIGLKAFQVRGRAAGPRRRKRHTFGLRFPFSAEGRWLKVTRAAAGHGRPGRGFLQPKIRVLT